MLLLTAAGTTYAQRIDTIKANPDAKPLRKIWQVTGGEFGGGRVGTGFGSCGDINQDGYEDWAVSYGDANEVRIYYGSEEPLDTTPVMILDSVGHSIVGDFWGTGHKAVGFTDGRRFDGLYYYALRLFRTDSNRLDTATSVLLDLHTLNPPVQSTPREVTTADLDNDGYDELVMMFAGRTVDGVSMRKPEVWIYRGGPEFQVDSPTVVLRDSEVNGGHGYQFMIVGNLDNDRKPDLVTGCDYADGIQKLKFFFSSEGSPWIWNEPHRIVPATEWLLTPPRPRFLDCDGDSLLDMAVAGPAYHVSLYLSSTGKDIHTRSFAFIDADRSYRAPYYIFPFSQPGYLSDSSQRYEMLDLAGNGVVYFFSGGPIGPDSYYDSYADEFYGRGLPVGDVNGDGWDEVMTGNSTVNFESGIAMIYAGGPYIPADPSLGVRAVASERRNDAITIWPNPATTELHIAWRGDLKRMPRGYRIHDMSGRLVAQGETPSWRGEMLWQCEDVAAGTYVLSIYDWQWELLATAAITKGR
jgi:hypothetical protein